MNRNLSILALTGLLATVLGGCAESEFRFNLFGRSSTELVDMATDPSDPDRRREGIMLLSEKEWGLQEEFLDVYRDILLRDPDPGVRAAAARAIGKSGNGRYAADLAEALEHEDENLRWNAAVALDSVVGDEARGPLMDHARRDDSKDVRAACALALRHYPDLEVVRTLVLCLRDPGFNVQFRARRALEEITGHDRGYNPEQWEDVAAGETPFVEGDDSTPWWDPLGVTG